MGIRPGGGLIIALSLTLLTMKPGWVASRALPSIVVRPPVRALAVGLPWLSVTDAGIIDDLGRRVLLRGFNTTSLLEWPRQPIAPLNTDDLDLMHRSGFNVIRLPIAWSRLEPERGHIDAAYLDRVVDTVRDVNRFGCTSSWTCISASPGARSSVARVADPRTVARSVRRRAGRPALIGHVKRLVRAALLVDRTSPPFAQGRAAV